MECHCSCILRHTNMLRPRRLKMNALGIYIAPFPLDSKCRPSTSCMTGQHCTLRCRTSRADMSIDLACMILCSTSNALDSRSLSYCPYCQGTTCPPGTLRICQARQNAPGSAREPVRQAGSTAGTNTFLSLSCARSLSLSFSSPLPRLSLSLSIYIYISLYFSLALALRLSPSLSLSMSLCLSVSLSVSRSRSRTRSPSRARSLSLPHSAPTIYVFSYYHMRPHATIYLPVHTL
jgi:hypothetical protein